MSKPEGRLQGLRRNAVGLMGTLYNSLAGQAPAYSVAGGAALIMGSAMAAAPLAMILTLLGVLAVVYAVFLLSRHFPHAASFYAYVTNTLNSKVGFFNGVVYTILYSIIGVGSVAIAFAYLGTEGIWAITGHSLNPLMLLFIPVVLALVPAVLGIRPSIRTELGLTSVEIVVLLIFVALTFHSHLTSLSLLPLTPQGTYATSLGRLLAALSGGLIFGITYFMGFEVSTQVSEEARDPRRSVPTGTLWATVIMGILYVLVTYAIVVNVGYSQSAINKFVNQASGMGPNPIYFQVKEYLGVPGLYLFAIAVMFSVFGCYLATLNATARMLYGMARDGLLPSWLARVHPRFRSPHYALYFSTGVAVLTIALAYLASYLGGARSSIGLTYYAMEDAYAIDSLYYVISLILIVVGAFRVSTWAGRVALVLGAALLALTLYYSVVNLWYAVALVLSAALIVVVELTALRPRLSRIRETTCPEC